MRNEDTAREALDRRGIHRRACGYRTPGALYIVSNKIRVTCGKLPHVLDTCPVCGQGIKPSSNWTRIAPVNLFNPSQCNKGHECSMSCPLYSPPDHAFLLWIGVKYYPTPEHFRMEAYHFGVSRRIKTLPLDFHPGSSIVMLAHIRGHYSLRPEGGAGPHPAIFATLKGPSVDYVTRGDETDEQLAKLVKRGVTPVRDVRIDEIPPHISQIVKAVHPTGTATGQEEQRESDR